MKTKDALIAVTAVACFLLGSAGAQATIILEDVNSEAEIDLTTDAGMFRWTVDGIENLRKQWFWYRIGDAGPEMPLDTLGTPLVKTSDGDLDVGDERLIARYVGPGFNVTVDYVLTGGPIGSGASDIAEVIAISNTGAAALDFHFFQYVDFELKGDPDDVSVEIRNGNTAIQTDADTWLSETVVTWAPDRCEASIGGGILAKLNDGDADDLNNSTGPLGPGDLSWAFQWDVDLGPGQTFIISKDKNLVPEPACLAILGLGSIMLMLRRRRRA